MKFYSLYTFAFISVLVSACGADDGGTRTAEPDVLVEDSSQAPSVSNTNRSVVLFLGNSLSAGYGVEPDSAFPNLIKARIDSLGWDFEIVNAGLSGETTSGGLRRIDWLLRQPVDVLVLELGGNDGLRGIPTEVTRANLQAIIDKTRARHPDAEIILAGMQIPPNLGHEYTEAFRDIFPSLAEENDAHLIPFLLEGVGGVDRLMQNDGIHPTEHGHRVVAENVWEILRGVLEDGGTG
jgi:acyl-CoA thioesterase-1